VAIIMTASGGII